ncbi:uncharacterized protein LOC136035436 [Artemia franciscana]|uniref:uncharacterized protein LOC136035436 n=1 Tax=Artemia franciscana TaxID=6661 RepID=UPI0032DB185B
MVTPGELENRNEYISSLSDFMEEAETNFNKILQSCGWERKNCKKCRSSPLTLDCDCLRLSVPVEWKNENRCESSSAALFKNNSSGFASTPEERLRRYDAAIGANRSGSSLVLSSDKLLTLDLSKPIEKPKSKTELLIENSLRKRKRPTYKGKTHTKSKNYKEPQRRLWLKNFKIISRFLSGK